MPFAPGARLGPYEILSAIGAGGMGEVYRARDSRLRRDIAIKVLPTARSSDPDRLVRFEQEARAAAALNHPNILAVHDIGSWRADGRELFYLAPDGKMMADDVSNGPGLVARNPIPLFQTPPGTIVGDVAADGQRFLLVTPVGPRASSPFTVVLNWTSGLKR